MKKIYCNSYLLPAIFWIFISCATPSTVPSVSEENNTHSKKKEESKKRIKVYGSIDPELKVKLKATFKATNAKIGCFADNSGWKSFFTVSTEDSSYNMNSYKLSAPLQWERYLGDNRCQYELHKATLKIEYPKKNLPASVTDLLRVSDSDTGFKINGVNHYDYNGDYIVRYLKEINILYCSTDENKTTNNFICVSDSDISNTLKDDTFPDKLDYHINIFIQK